jgi:hypothetical protein
VLTDPSQQAWLEKMPSSLGDACPIDQPEEQKGVTFEVLVGLMALTKQKASGF